MEEDTIYRYFTCQTTEEEDKAILDWIKASKENEALFFELKTIWHSCSEQKREDPWVLKHSLNSLNQRIDNLENSLISVLTPENISIYGVVLPLLLPSSLLSRFSICKGRLPYL